MRLDPKSTFNARFVEYVRDSIPQLLSVGPIVSALAKHGKFKPADVKKALQFGTGPLIRSDRKLHLFESEVDSKAETITISKIIVEEYEFLRSPWNRRKSAAERDEFAKEMADTHARIWHRPHTGLFTDHQTAFLTTKSGKRVWAVGAILLESLVRLGAGRTMTPDKAQEQSMLFQKAVYGQAMVNSARGRYSVARHMIESGQLGPRFKRGLEQAHD